MRSFKVLDLVLVKEHPQVLGNKCVTKRSRDGSIRTVIAHKHVVAVCHPNRTLPRVMACIQPRGYRADRATQAGLRGLIAHRTDEREEIIGDRRGIVAVRALEGLVSGRAGARHVWLAESK